MRRGKLLHSTDGYLKDKDEEKYIELDGCTECQEYSIKVFILRSYTEDNIWKQ